MGTHTFRHLLGDKDPVQAVEKSHVQKEGPGEKRKSALTTVCGADIALPPCTGTGVLGPRGAMLLALHPQEVPALFLAWFRHVFAAGIPPCLLRNALQSLNSSSWLEAFPRM